MIHQLINHDWAHFWISVAQTRSSAELGHAGRRVRAKRALAQRSEVRARTRRIDAVEPRPRLHVVEVRAHDDLVGRRAEARVVREEIVIRPEEHLPIPARIGGFRDRDGDEPVTELGNAAADAVPLRLDRDPAGMQRVVDHARVAVAGRWVDRQEEEVRHGDVHRARAVAIGDPEEEVDDLHHVVRPDRDVGIGRLDVRLVGRVAVDAVERGDRGCRSRSRRHLYGRRGGDRPRRRWRALR